MFFVVNFKSIGEVFKNSTFQNEKKTLTLHDDITSFYVCYSHVTLARLLNILSKLSPGSKTESITISDPEKETPLGKDSHPFGGFPSTEEYTICSPRN